MKRCPICHRPVLGEACSPGERPCSVPEGERCYRLGFERRGRELSALAVVCCRYLRHELVAREVHQVLAGGQV